MARLNRFRFFIILCVPKTEVLDDFDFAFAPLVSHTFESTTGVCDKCSDTAQSGVDATIADCMEIESRGVQSCYWVSSYVKSRSIVEICTSRSTEENYFIWADWSDNYIWSRWNISALNFDFLPLERFPADLVRIDAWFDWQTFYSIYVVAVCRLATKDVNCVSECTSAEAVPRLIHVRRFEPSVIFNLVHVDTSVHFRFSFRIFAPAQEDHSVIEVCKTSIAADNSQVSSPELPNRSTFYITVLKELIAADT